MPKVTPIPGERWCFHVESETPNHEPYRVDVLANNGLGFCSCPNWGVVRWKDVKQGKFNPCKHIKAVMESEWSHIMAAIKKQSHD